MIFFFISSLSAQTLCEGEEVPFKYLYNQYDKKVLLSQAKYWVIVQDKSVSYLANDYFLQKHRRLKSGEVVYILNIEKIPYLIYHFFVKNSMESFPFEIMISDRMEENSYLPYKADTITIVKFKNQRAEKISFADSNTTLDLALDVTP